MFCLIVHTGPVSVLPCSCIILVPRGDRRKYLYLFLLSEWKISFLHWLLLSAAAAGKLIHAPSGLHLTNLQSKPCKSIQLEVNCSAGSCQLQTGLHPAESQGSSSTDREGLTQRNWPGGHCDTESHLFLLSTCESKDKVMWDWKVKRRRGEDMFSEELLEKYPNTAIWCMIHIRLKLTSNDFMMKLISDLNLRNYIATANVKFHIVMSETKSARILY